MNASSWYTKKDVMQDLAVATGVLVDFDEDFIVRGQKPPPNRYCAVDEDEMEIRFGNIKGVSLSESVKPDLNGITEMLRMVDKDGASNKSKDDCDEQSGDKKQIHTISKLNPDVNEFVPKGARINSDKASDKFNDENISDIMNKSDSSKCDSDKQKMEAILKEKIKETSKAHTLKDKKEKNVAIAALMKLNSAPQPNLQTSTPPIVSSSPKPMVLYPPEYYESGPPKEEPKQIDEIQKPERSEPSASVVKVDIENKYSNDPSVRESIKKVNSWFEKPVTTTDFVKESLKCEKPKTPVESPKKQTMPLAPPLESFSYRKKGKSCSSSQTKSPLPEVKPVTATPAYKPSPYAAELAKAYAERRKTQDKDEHVDVFTKLHRDLEVRDEQIRKKKRETQAGESSNMTSPISGR